MRRVSRRAEHWLVLAAGTAPALGLLVDGLRDDLGANPVETITHVTGDWTLRLLLATLAVTPLRRLLGWHRLAPHRRTLGLLAFSYACLHLATFVALDLGFDPGLLAEEVTERPYITVGFASFVLLVPLALTSTRGAIRRLGRRWQTLHRLVYLAAVGGVVHFLWSVKADQREPWLYAAVLAALLAGRLVPSRRRAALRRPGALTGAERGSG
jgi:sulfoxide reductase heme-binding subunit YedZ